MSEQAATTTRTYTVTKRSGGDKYVVTNRGWCATIYLDEATGEVAVVQGYSNNYDYCWSAPGRGKETLKEFLLSSNMEYVMEKFGYGRPKWLDFDKSLLQLKKDLKEKFDAGEINKNVYTCVRGEIDDCLEGNEVASTSDWYSLLSQCEEIINAYDGDYTALPSVTDYHPQLRGFMEHIWPAFLEVIRLEVTK